MLMKEVFIIALGYCNEIGTKIMKEKMTLYHVHCIMIYML